MARHCHPGKPDIRNCPHCRASALPGHLRPGAPTNQATPYVAPPKFVTFSLKCINEGNVLEYCTTCGGLQSELRHVRECDIFGKCTYGKNQKPDKVATCDGCLFRETENSVKTASRHLIYHVYPLRTGNWQKAVDRIVKRLHIFNGKIIVSIANDHATDSPDQVIEAFGKDKDIEFIVTSNHPVLGEVVSWNRMMPKVMEYTSPSDITLYAHAKGVTRGDSPTINTWCDLLHEINIDHIDLVERQLSIYPITGAFKKTGHGFTDNRCDWHYSGTFFWMRNKEVSRRSWKDVGQYWGGVEAWVGRHFHPDEAGCLFHEAKTPLMNLYDNTYMQSVVLPKYLAWNESLRVKGKEQSNLKTQET